MKLFSIRHGLWIVLLCMGAPALMTGCGGGNDDGLQVPVIPVSIPQFALQNGQLATLNLVVRGTSAVGTLAIADGAQPASSPRFPPGLYPVDGSFTAPRAYAVNGDFMDLGAFRLSGDLPTTSRTGTYTIDFQDQTTSGTLPALSNTAS